MKMNARNRKQKFTRRHTQHSESCCTVDDYTDEEDDDRLTIPKKVKQISSQYKTINNNNNKSRLIKNNEDKNTPQSTRLDKQARDEHNEQERSRRRELAIIYELIRCSFNEDDLRHLGNLNSAPKSIDKLSYPQVLHIAYQILLEEHHNLELYEKTLSDVKKLEKELSKCGLVVPNRPQSVSMFENYRKVFNIVENLLKFDKVSRTKDGSYEMTPAERASLGDQQLTHSKKQSANTLVTPSGGSYNHLHSTAESFDNFYDKPSSSSTSSSRRIKNSINNNSSNACNNNNNNNQASSSSSEVLQSVHTHLHQDSPPIKTEFNDDENDVAHFMDANGVLPDDLFDSSFSLFDNYDSIFPDKLSADVNFNLLNDLEPFYQSMKLDSDAFV